MKILIIGPAHPLRGGIASSTERLGKEFLNEGHEVTIYTFSLQYPSFLFPGTSQFSTEPAPEGININACINSINPFNWLKIGNRIKKMKPDLLVVRFWLPFMGPCLGTILRRVKKNRHTKIVCVVDNMVPHEKRFGDKPFTKYFVKPVDAFVGMSEKVIKDIQLFAKEKPTRYVPLPLFDNLGEKISKQEARKFLGISDEQRVVLFFGFIRKYKGLDLLLDAVKILKDKSATLPTNRALGAANCVTIIAGEFYEDRKPYDEQIEALGIRDRLMLRTDFIPGSEVKYYFCAADLVIQPYKNATQSGVTPVAYHFEKPMVVTNVGGLPDQVPDGRAGLVAEPNAESLAEKIIQYFEKGEDYFIPMLLEEKKKFSWSNMTKSILELTQSI